MSEGKIYDAASKVMTQMEQSTMNQSTCLVITPEYPSELIEILWWICPNLEDVFFFLESQSAGT